MDEAVCRGEDVLAADQGAAAHRLLGARLGDEHLPGVAVPLRVLPAHDVVIASLASCKFMQFTDGFLFFDLLP